MRASSLIAGTSSLAILALAAGHAAAQVDEAGADTIRRGIENYITQYLVVGPDSEITLNGDVMVSPQDTTYDVTLPAFVVNLEGPSVTVDPISAELTPIEDGWFDVTWTVPSEYVLGFGDMPMVTMTVGNQVGEGTFAPPFESFLDLNFILERLEVIPAEEEGSATIDTVSLTLDSEDVGGGLYDSEFDMVMAGFDFDPGEDQGMLILDEFGFSGSIQDLDVAEYTVFGQELNRLMNEAGMDSPRGPDPAALAAMGELLRNTPNLFSGMDLTYRMHGLQFAERAEGVNLDSATFGVFTEGLDGPTGTFGVNATMDTLSLQPVPPFAGVIPQELRADVRLVDLPTDQMVTLLADFLTQTNEMGPDQAMAMLAIGFQQAVMQSGASLEIPEVFVDLGVSQMNLDGVVMPNAQSPLGVSADALLTITNMPGLIGELQALGPMGQAPVQGLTVLQPMGQVSQNDAGQSVHTFEFVVTDAGQVLLNGSDMAPLMGQLMQ